MIEGKTVGLRAIEEKDLAILRDWRNIESFRKHFREVRELNMANQKKWFEKTNNSPNDFMFMIVRLDNNEPIGACGLLYINNILRMADYSFYIGNENNYIDDKYAKEATQLLLNYGYNQLNLNKVWMELYEYDTAKIDFFTKEFNFKVDGKLRQNCFYDGKYWDSYIISLLAEEYK
jgi:RimJ/RimL family protein N-acetyltransferase